MRAIDAVALDQARLNFIASGSCKSLQDAEAFGQMIRNAKTIDCSAVDEIEQLICFLGLYCAAPENAPDDWLHHGNENISAWFRFIEESKKRGYYTLEVKE